MDVVWSAGSRLAAAAGEVDELLATLHSVFTQVLNSLPWLWIAIGSALSFFALESFLDVLQVQQLKHCPFPAVLRRYVEPESFSRTKQWNVQRLNFLRVESALGFALECAALYFGALVWLWGVAARAVALTPLAGSEVVVGVVFVLLVSLTSALVRLPTEMLRVVWIDSSFDLSLVHHTLLGWIKDQLALALVSIAVGVPVGALLLLVVHMRVPYFYIVCSVTISLVALFLSEVYPIVFAPMFNQFVRLAPGDLRTEIAELCRRANLPLADIKVVFGRGGRAAHSNVFIAGIGLRKTIVLYNTVVTQLNTAEVLALVAHEIGHWRFSHTFKHLVAQQVCIGNFLFVFSILLDLPHFYRCFGFDRPHDAAGLVLFAYMYTSFSSVVLVVLNLITRSFEYACDEFAVCLEPRLHVESSLIKLHARTPLTMVPHRAYSIYHYGHPSLMERLDWLAEVRKKLK